MKTSNLIEEDLPEKNQDNKKRKLIFVKQWYQRREYLGYQNIGSLQQAESAFLEIDEQKPDIKANKI
ncbi:MAG: hypothetical protein JXN62_14215 [Bacteroidales bacterium]|nr:hypothetical protein [Bacteroidales bacterium]